MGLGLDLDLGLGSRAWAEVRLEAVELLGRDEGREGGVWRERAEGGGRHRGSACRVSWSVRSAT